MFPPFSQFTARHYIQLLIDEITQKKVEIVQLTKISEERQGSGVMLGSLVCSNRETKERVVLYAISGISKQLEFLDKISSSKYQKYENGIKFEIVPPIADANQINKALSKNDNLIHQLTEQINAGKKELSNIRTKLTTESLQSVFSLYNFIRFDGSNISLNQIISQKSKLPPTGTGDCCAPKLLSYAFSHKLQPVSMDEIFYGKGTPNKKTGTSYTPCDERCGYILPDILGLEILYCDSQIVVINKQPGLLSVPGRGPEKADCAESRLKMLFPDTIVQPAVHRLDMETSGILILARNKVAHRNLNIQFAEGKVNKKYEAILEGILQKAEGLSAPKHGEQTGKMSLPFRLDVENRPYQIYDEINGKIGITEWENLGTVNCCGRKCTKVLFKPLTGRTHQLRLAASDIHGFGMPILGDSLYGSQNIKNNPEIKRLMLHCAEIEFYHPVSGQLMHFECKSGF